jgi:alpha-tubulin suppressor-like RCC1 family protein
VTLSDIEQISCGGQFVCARRANDQVFCWGNNDKGQIGLGLDESTYDVPSRVTGHTFVQLATGDEFACGVKDDSTLWCWGYLPPPMVEDDAPVVTPEPVQIEGIEVIKAMPPEPGANFMLVGASGGSDIYAWGRNVLGQLALGSFDDTVEPTVIPGVDFSDLQGMIAGPTAHHACAIQDGALRCWGANANGQLGVGDRIDRASPVLTDFDGSDASSRVLPGPHSVGVGRAHTCAIAENGSVYCWGSNGRRQLGNNQAQNPQTSPIQVDFL